jgi:hypothetical protein
VPQATVTAQVHQTLDIHGYFSAQIAFHLELRIYDLPDRVDLRFRKIVTLRVPTDAGLIEYLLGSRAAYTIDVSQSDLYAFILWQVNTGNTCQCELLLLALSLLVAWIFADNPHRAMTANDPTLPTYSLNRCSHLHATISFFL